MIRLTITFCALASAATIYNAANRASLDAALQVGLMLAVGCCIGALVVVDRTKEPR